MMASFTTSGLSVLSVFERAGMIKRIVPLSASLPEINEELLRRPSIVAMVAGAIREAPAEPTRGVNLIELERDSDVPEVQMQLARDPNVENVSRVPVRYLLAKKKVTRKRSVKGGATIAATPPAAATLWNLQRIRWSEARAANGFQDANEVKVAVLDTGIDPEHPDLEDRIDQYEFSHPDVPSGSSAQDIIGHGTHVAGTIAASIDNDIGINGICACRLHVWKIFDDVPDYDSQENEFVYYVEPVMYRRALQGCLQEQVKIINLSIGGPGRPDFVEQQLFDLLLDQGAIIAAAMGNEATRLSPGIISYPAAIPGVIAVGATDRADRRAAFSNHRGNHISICAPGVDIWSTLPRYPGQFGFTARTPPSGRPIPDLPQSRDTDYDSWPGTSMASPHVAGAAALLVANRGDMDGAAAKERLEETADKVPRMNGEDFHQEYGYGRLNLHRLLTE
jgi:subtilisin family serine protease